MKTIRTGAAAWVALSMVVAAPLIAAPKAQTLKIVPAQSKVEWTGKKVTGQHHGTVNVKEGEVQIANNALTDGKVVIDMTSIKDIDLEGDSNAKLTGHLRSEDFFSVEKNPTATFDITQAEALSGVKAGEPNYRLTGDLTIKGMAHKITFPATVTVDATSVRAMAKGVKIDRTLYGIRYGSGKFFQNLGDKVIDDHFLIDFDVVAKK